MIAKDGYAAKVQGRKAHHLISLDSKVLYAFHPRQDGEVKIVQSFPKDIHTYVLPKNEARQLYRRLLNKGYSPW